MDDQPAGTQSHDPDYPENLLAFMRTGWRDAGLAVTPRPEAQRYASRRAALRAAFPGETLVIPSGREQVRANDTFFPFRPGTDLVYLTGEHDPDSVLVLRAGRGGDGDATLYAHPRAPRDTDECFRDRNYGELWVGRRYTLQEKAAELGVPTADLAKLPEALDDCAPGRTRVLRGLDPAVDTAVRGDPER